MKNNRLRNIMQLLLRILKELFILFIFKLLCMRSSVRVSVPECVLACGRGEAQTLRHLRTNEGAGQEDKLGRYSIV